MRYISQVYFFAMPVDSAFHHGQWSQPGVLRWNQAEAGNMLPKWQCKFCSYILLPFLQFSLTITHYWVRDWKQRPNSASRIVFADYRFPTLSTSTDPRLDSQHSENAQHNTFLTLQRLNIIAKLCVTYYFCYMCGRFDYYGTDLCQTAIDLAGLKNMI